MSRTILELRNITKVFPGVKALDHVNFSLEEGEIHALMGENGAGKSTLIKIVTGIYQPDEGEILLDGKPIVFKDPRDVFQHSINVVHQERNLIPTFTVAENIMLEEYSANPFSRINEKAINEKAMEYIDAVGLNISPTKSVETLTAGKKQLVEIAKALSSNAKIILLDEPTASISQKEVGDLLDLVRRLRDRGVSFIFVSHKLEEVMSLVDRVTVLRDGKNAKGAGTPDVAVPIKELTRDGLITLMVGRTEEFRSLEHREFKDKEVVLEAKELRSVDSPKPKSFQLHKGELLGWYGLVGAGRTEFARALIGYDPPIAGEEYINGEKVEVTSIQQMQRHKLYYLSENRKEEGLFLEQTIIQNISSSILERIKNKLGFINRKEEEEIAKKFVEELSIKTPSLKQLVGNLSGGNQQKVSLAKGLSVEPDIIIIDEPTVGVDVKTKSEIHRLMYELTEAGKSVICITSELPELIAIADRVVVFRDGVIKGEMDNTKNYDEMSKKIMEMIMGAPETLSSNA